LAVHPGGAGDARPPTVPARVSRREGIAQASARVPFRLKVAVVWIAIFLILAFVFAKGQFDLEFMQRSWKFILGGLQWTILVALGSIVLAVILALIGSLGRLSRNPVAYGVSGFYTSFFRGTPLIVQIFLITFAIPPLVQNLGLSEGIEDLLTFDPFVAGILALGLNYGAYMTEIFRAGIQSIGHGQSEAAEALGMSYRQKMQRIILPQAIRVIIPPTGNEFIAMMKDTALVSFAGVAVSQAEIFRRADLVGKDEFRPLEALLLAAAAYWALTAVFTFFQSRLERRLSKGYVRTDSKASTTGRKRMTFLKGGGPGGGGAPAHGTVLTTDETGATKVEGV
jgi:polar amino acid transport system permease protein